MSAYVLLKLLNELRKRDDMRNLPSILSLFPNEFNKFNNKRARILDSIKMTLKSHFRRKKFNFCLYVRCYGRHTFSRNICKPLVVIDFIAWRYFTRKRNVILYFTIIDLSLGYASYH